MRIASQSDMRSFDMSGIKRPSKRFTMSSSFARPASMRALHQIPPARRDERHPVALAGALLEEARDRRLRLVGPQRRDVHVVEEDDEGPAAALLGRRVEGDLRRGRRRRGRLLRQDHRLEGRDRLGDPVLGDREVLAREVPDDTALLVGHHGVHDDLLDLGGEGGGLRRLGRRLRLRGLGLGGLRLLGDQRGGRREQQNGGSEVASGHHPHPILTRTCPSSSFTS